MRGTVPNIRSHGMLDRGGQSSNMPPPFQQQQMMMLQQQQQFMARQQVIQQEQLQKQRQLRQEEEKQAGLAAAIRGLQQKTLNHHNQQRPPFHPPSVPLNRPPPPQAPHSPGLSPPPHAHRFPPTNLQNNSNQDDFGEDTYPTSSNRSNNHVSVPRPSLNSFSQPNNFQHASLHNPPFLPPNLSSPPPPLNIPTPPQFNRPPSHSYGGPNRDLASSNSRTTPISQPPGFDKPGLLIRPGVNSDRPSTQTPPFGQFTGTSNAPPVLFPRGPAPSAGGNPRPPLLDFPGSTSPARLPGISANRNPAFVSSQNVQLNQAVPSNSSAFSSRFPCDGGRGNKNNDSFSKTTLREMDRGDRTSIELSRLSSKDDRSGGSVSNSRHNREGSVGDHRRDREGSIGNHRHNREGSIGGHRNDREGSIGNHRRDREGSIGGHRHDYEGSIGNHRHNGEGSISNHRHNREGSIGSHRRDYDRESSRDMAGDRGSPGRDRHGRHGDRPPERCRSDNNFRDEPRHSGDRTHSRSRDRTRGSDRGSSSVDRNFSSSEAGRRNRSQTESRSPSRESSSTRRDRNSKGEAPSQRHASSHSSRDSSRTGRDTRYKRSRSPSLSSDRNSTTSAGNQLSQYRQDLLKSEQRSHDPSKLSPKRRKLDFDVDDDYLDLNKEDDQEPEVDNISYFIRSCPADLFFSKNLLTGDMEASTKMVELEAKFEEEIVKRAETIRAAREVVTEPAQQQHPQPPINNHLHNHHGHHHHCSGHKSSSCDSSSDNEDDDDDDDDDEGSCSQIMQEWDMRKKHVLSLHPELWFNLKGQANDGPLCRCSIKSRQSGIRHEIYPGEKSIDLCQEESNNLSRLHHYRITVSPYTNFLTKVPTLINHDNHEYIFEGFSMFSHIKLDNMPPCKLLRFNIEYTIHFIPENAPENFTVRSLNLFNRFIFTDILELIDVDWAGPSGGCQRFHFMPRFCRTLPDSGCKEVLSMNTVLSFLLKSAKLLVEESRLQEIMQCGESEWHAKVDHLRGMIVTNPGMKPSSLRIDQLDRKVTTPIVRADIFDENSDEKKKEEKRKKEEDDEEKKEVDGQPRYPLIIHQGYRPAQLSYAGDPVYRKAWKQYVKFRHLLNSKPKILAADKMKLKDQEEKLREIRMKKTMKREVTIELSSKGFLCTGLRADLCQHALMMPVLMNHLRFHICLDMLEETLRYKFKDRSLLQLSLTHTSYRTNYGVNPDHTRNSLTNCGMRQVEYGDRRIHYQNTRKRGICILVDIMSRLGKQEETISEIPHNERLEFLGDAVIEFLTSVHLFYMFPWLEEGGLTTYRMALVQNQHLAILAKKLKLQDFMLYVHGPDLCHESDLRHAMANCCEAIMGALFLDGGIGVADAIFSRTLFDDEDVLLQTWNDLPRHVLQQEEPGGDRHWVKSSPILQKMEKFENMIGIKFNHIRLLAKAFTHRNIGVNPLTLGHNQRLEFLGDTVLQLIASEYLYRHYPEHHEGHLSLLRSSLVNSRTQGLVYDDLGMSEFVIYNENAISDGVDMKTKQRADILESFVGALFVDKDLDYCRSFCNVCFFPRLKDFIMNQDWNDPKSQLQQCCLTLREVGGGEPDIPVYKVIKSIGPTNTRKYVVAVYFRGKRLARGTGHSIQQAEMAAATQALKKRAELFPILQHQRRFLEHMRNEDFERGSSEELSPPKTTKRSRHSQRQRNAGRKKK